MGRTKHRKNASSVAHKSSELGPTELPTNREVHGSWTATHWNAVRLGPRTTTALCADVSAEQTRQVVGEHLQHGSDERKPSTGETKLYFVEMEP